MSKLRIAYGWVQRTAHMMIGIPDYETYVRHRKAFHPNEPVMSYEEFFFERQSVRYTVSKERMKGCC